ncbi:MAG: hypothetical protein JF616_15405 [Fibrobacteres bacterium]|nr:hypothetical protein [Fibrobacterota bacterium]
MKFNFPNLRIAAALGLAAGMMIGCQDLLNPGKTASDPGATSVDQTGSLSLSIRNDSTCMGEWHAILDARSAGHPDSASESAFLASCVTEVKPEKDKPVPVIPPPLLPDSGTRCKWIVAQIEGGRDSLSVSYRKYCPDDCRKLEATDSASHEKLCLEPKPHTDSLPPKPHDDDSLPPRTNPEDDTCKMLLVKLGTVKPGEPGRADLEHQYTARCHEPVPHDSTPVPPPPPTVNCDELRKKIALLDSGSADYASLVVTLKAHCPEKPPVTDTTKIPPQPPVSDSVCMALKLQLANTPAGTAGRSDLEAAFKAKCSEPVPVTAPIVNCDELRAKRAALDPASADYAQLTALMKGHCPDVP